MKKIMSVKKINLSIKSILLMIMLLFVNSYNNSGASERRKMVLYDDNFIDFNKIDTVLLKSNENPCDNHHTLNDDDKLNHLIDDYHKNMVTFKKKIEKY